VPRAGQVKHDGIAGPDVRLLPLIGTSRLERARRSSVASAVRQVARLCRSEWARRLRSGTV